VLCVCVLCVCVCVCVCCFVFAFFLQNCNEDFFFNGGYELEQFIGKLVCNLIRLSFCQNALESQLPSTIAQAYQLRYCTCMVV
jgi:hypothetical protein